MLAGLRVDVPDTRSWRLEPLRSTHPVIAALTDWRKAERIATTYGHGWLDAHVLGGRLRGQWAGSDGAAGRMTARSGLHNLPAELRPAIAAEAGHVLVRADLAQVEPRVLAVVSGDRELAAAAQQDDLYALVAMRLGVTRPVTKVGVLATMYGQPPAQPDRRCMGCTTRTPPRCALPRRRLEDGRAGCDVRTHGGRLVRMPALTEGLDEAGVRAVQGARGRYARNALVQGAAAELFKMWAVTVRSRVGGFDGGIVLYLHDELLLHVPQAHGAAAGDLLRSCLAENARRWQAGRAELRFVADVNVVHRWSEAKPLSPEPARSSVSPE